MDTKTKKALFDSPIFSGMSEEKANELSEKAEFTVGRFLAGERIPYKEKVGTLISGEARIYSENEVLLNILGKGALFGVGTVFSDSPEPTVIKAVKETEILFIERREIEKLCDDKEFRRNFLEFLTGRIAFLNSKIRTFSAPNAEKKFLGFIIEKEENGRVPLSVSYVSLANSLGMGRASLYRIITSLEKEKAIERLPGEIIITDKEKIVEKFDKEA